ncbi:MAG: DUF1616 domain-containing protein [Candidatus Bathyarchaeia archaeon]
MRGKFAYISHTWFLLLIFFIIFTTTTIYLAPQTQCCIYLRYISASIIPIFLLGFAFIQMLFAEEGCLDHVDKAVLSLGTSLALTPLVTLILNYTPYGVNQNSVFASLTLLTILFAVGALIRKSLLKIGVRNLQNRADDASLSLRGIFPIIPPLLVAVSLRVYPFLMSGLPFSVDAWPSIKYAEAILEHSPVHLDYGVLRGCDELGDRLFGSAISALTGLQPLKAMGFFIPLAGATSITTLYALARETFDGKVSLLASMLLATAFTDVILTAGVKGETYAHPLYMLLIFLYIHRDMARWKKTLLFSIVGASLTLTHYYTAILTAAILASMDVAMLILKWGRGVSFEVQTLLFPLLLAFQVLAYLKIYANWAFNFILKIDWLSAASYQLIAFSSALHLTLKQHTPSRKRPIICITASLIAFTLAFLATKRPLAPGAPILPEHYLIYASPFIVAAPLSTLGYSESRSPKIDCKILPLFWLAAVLGLEGYAVFGNVEPGLGLTLAYRGVNFLLPPLFILSALGFIRLSEDEFSSLPKPSKALAIIILIIVSASNLSAFHATLFKQERYIGYFWLYRLSEYRAGTWISSTCGNRTIACDVKFAYLLRHYFGLRVEESRGLLYLIGKGSSEPEFLLTYDQMLKSGYVVYGGYSVDLPENFMERAYKLSLIYSNGRVDGYAGGDA